MYCIIREPCNKMQPVASPEFRCKRARREDNFFGDTQKIKFMHYGVTVTAELMFQ